MKRRVTVLLSEQEYQALMRLAHAHAPPEIICHTAVVCRLENNDLLRWVDGVDGELLTVEGPVRP